MNLQGNWVDLVIIVILIYMVADSWKTGFFVLMADFVGFLFSLIIALMGYSFLAGILINNFGLARSLANAIGFFATAGISEAVIGFILINVLHRVPYHYWKKSWNNIAGIIPSLGQGLILIAFILTLIVSLPLSPAIKRDVTKSKIGNYLVKETSGIEAKLNEVFGGLVEDSLTYMTVKPGSTQSIPISAEATELEVDEYSEGEMLKLVNTERRKRGIRELTWRDEVVPVARAHARDMWERNYFGHVSPDGEDVGDRLNKAEVNYFLAGENLALAPTLNTAHTGLMNSEGHKRNILDPEFKRMGIGVIDNGIYGKMFVQIFTD